MIPKNKIKRPYGGTLTEPRITVSETVAVDSGSLGGQRTISQNAVHLR